MNNSSQRVVYDRFNGLYKRGNNFEVPPEYSLVCKNFDLTKNKLRTRDGLAVSIATQGVPERIFLSTINNVNNLLYLTSSGSIYKDTDVSPLYTVAGMYDFRAININNRTYIMPISSSASTLLVWDGTNPPRNAAGLAPTAGSTISVTNGAAGKIDAGLHKFAVCYETNTGFITQPGVKVSGVFTPGSYTATGALKADLSNIPIGPTGTVKRHLLATKSNQDIYYFIPDGILNNNTATTLTVNFSDIELIEDASDYFDLLETIPGGLDRGALAKYENRLVVAGGEKDIVRISDPDDPESFNNVDGFILVPTENDGNYVAGLAPLRGALYMFKSVGIFSVQDNGSVPSTWVTIPIEGSVGGTATNIASITFSQSPLTAHDYIVMADFGGVYGFNGVPTSDPLTYNIDNDWKSLVTPASNNQEKVTIFIDPFKKIIYVAIKDSSTMYVGFYDGLPDKTTIRWATWEFPAAIKTIALGTYTDGGGTAYALRVGLTGLNNIYRITPNQYTDYGIPITSQWRTNFIQGDFTSINHYKAFEMYIKGINGTGIVQSTLFKFDETTVPAFPNMTVGTAPTQPFFIRLNYKGEVASFNFSTTLIIEITKFIAFYDITSRQRVR